MVKLDSPAATAIISDSEKKVFTLRILRRMGYDISTATVSLMLIKMKFLLYSSLSYGSSTRHP